MRTPLLLFVFLFLGGGLFGKGSISGTIKEGATAETLIGVSVTLHKEGSAAALMGAVTDLNGSFKFEADPGNYYLEIKYIGFQTKVVEHIRVPEGGNVPLQVVLDEKLQNSLEEIVIRGTMDKGSINALYTVQKTAVSVSSGISADIIKHSPDKNTGEVLKRVSGASVQNNKFVVVRGLNDRYNAAMINKGLMPTTEPNRKAFSFDIIPSNLIDNLTISKTASPDLPGDFSGGIIRVFTKDIPDENFVNIGMSLGYNTQSTFKDFVSNGHTGLNKLGFENPERKLPSAFGSDYTDYKSQPIDQRIATSQTLPNSFKEESRTALPSQSYQLSWGDVRYLKNGARFGSILALNYRRAESYSRNERRRLISDYTWTYDFPEEDRYAFSVNSGAMANFTYLAGNHKIAFKNFYNKMYDDVYFVRNGFNVSNMQQQDIRSSVPMDKALFNTQLEGEHAFGNATRLDWNLNYTQLNANQNDLRTAFYSRPTALDAQHLPEMIQAPYEIVDRNSRRFFSNMTDRNYGGNLNFSTAFNLFNQKQFFKAGYGLLSRNRDFHSRIFNYEITNPATFDPSRMDLPVGEIFERGHLGPEGFVLNEFTNPTDAYDVSGLLNTGYLMLDNHFSDKLRLSWGLRLEHYAQDLNIKNLSAQQVTFSDSYLDLLPSLNLTYKLTDASNMRVAASQTVSRPEFWEIAPFSFYDFDNNWVIEGNPELLRGKTTNLDLRYEIYPKAGETVSFSVFYKHFNNPIETYLMPTSGDADYIGYTNSKAAQSIGAELEFRKGLGFIRSTGFFSDVTLAGNLAYIYSQVDLDGFSGAGNRPMTGQSPYLINLSAQYLHPELGLTTTLLFNRIGQRVAYVGNANRPNILENGRSVLDFQLAKSLLNQRAELKFTVGDIFNAPYVFYQDMNNDSRAYQPNTGALNDASGDSVFRRYQLGTSYSLGFTYNFKY